MVCFSIRDSVHLLSLLYTYVRICLPDFLNDGQEQAVRINSTSVKP